MKTKPNPLSESRINFQNSTAAWRLSSCQKYKVSEPLVETDPRMLSEWNVCQLTACHLLLALYLEILVVLLGMIFSGCLSDKINIVNYQQREVRVTCHPTELICICQGTRSQTCSTNKDTKSKFWVIVCQVHYLGRCHCWDIICFINIPLYWRMILSPTFVFMVMPYKRTMNLNKSSWN